MSAALVSIASLTPYDTVGRSQECYRTYCNCKEVLDVLASVLLMLHAATRVAYPKNLSASTILNAVSQTVQSHCM